MKKAITVTCILAAVMIVRAISGCAEMITTSWGGDAEYVYNTGFMHMLMRYPGGGVCLFNQVLIENDSPGVGVSEKGPNLDPIWGQYRGRKVFRLDDPRARSAFIIIMPAYGRPLKHPLRFLVNGHETEYTEPGNKQTVDYYRLIEFPSGWLKKGENVIDFYCPDAKAEDEGWFIFTPRADDFEQGGGDPSRVGETSWKSSDGGRTWKKSPFSPDGTTRAEYALRLSLDRYEERGWLASPVIDLWKGNSADSIVPLREVRSMRLSIRAEAPEETMIDYFIRRGKNPQPFSYEWEPYRSVGSGSAIDIELAGAELNRRYIQFKAILSTRNPLKSPVITSARVTAELEERVPPHDNNHVVEQYNPTIKYSSVDFAWEN